MTDHSEEPIDTATDVSGSRIWITYDDLTNLKLVQWIHARWRDSDGCTCSSCLPDLNIIPWYSWCRGDIFKVKATGHIYKLTGHYKLDDRAAFEAIRND